jgi:hypothetical protein
VSTKTCNACGAEKSLEEFYYNKKWNSHQGRCKECARSYGREYARANKDKAKAWREANKDRLAAWREANREDQRQKARERYAEKVFAERGHLPWQGGRKYPFSQEAMKRNKNLLRMFYAMPEELRLQCEAVYHERKRRSVETGEKLHVDHVSPIQGRNVSGLHVPWNLRIVPARVNNKKYYLDEDDPCGWGDDARDMFSVAKYSDDAKDYKKWRWPKGK